MPSTNVACRVCQCRSLMLERITLFLAGVEQPRDRPFADFWEMRRRGLLTLSILVARSTPEEE